MNSSRLLNRLDSEIASTTDMLSINCLRVERACYLCRQGHCDEARSTVLEIREYYRRVPNLEISVWLSLAEGLLIHFSNMGTLARDKFHRAYALSAAGGLTQMNSVCAAWLANMDYLLGDMKSMVHHVGQSLGFASEENHSARSRANLVVAHAYHLSARLDLARPWYAKAHQHAVAEGDDATVSALMHNMAWLRFANLLQETVCGSTISASGEHALSSANSTLQWDSMKGSTSLQALAPILRAQILVVSGQFHEALSLYEKHMSSAILQGMEKQHANLVADQAWCRVNMSQRDAAFSDAYYAESLINPVGHFDDRAPAHSRLAQVYSALGLPDSAARHSEFAKIAWHGHTELQNQTLSYLADLAKFAAPHKL